MHRNWLLPIVLCLAGCSKEESATAPPTSSPPAPSVSREINEFFAKALSDHGFHSCLDGDWVTLDRSPVAMNGFVAEPANRDTDLVILQLEMRLKLADGRVITQQLAGWGKTRDEAIGHAEASFVLGTFHAWLGAFIDPQEEHAEHEELTIGGKKRIAWFGNVVTKVVGGENPTERGWQKTFRDELEKSSIGPGLHWVNLYHDQIGEHEQLEIQLDSKRWAMMEERMKLAAWPRGGDLTSVRQFVVIQDLDDPTRPKKRPTTHPVILPASVPSTKS